MGCAGLSLAVRMILSGHFGDKKVLLVDREEKSSNDRTWCFWEKEDGIFQEIVFKEWETLFFHSASYSREMQIAPYRYKMIRGIDFYTYCLSVIKNSPGFDIHYGEVTRMAEDAGVPYVVIDDQKVTAGYIFNSILFEKPLLRKKEYYLLQHFKGWLIETDEPVFDPGKAILMDFRVSQHRGTTFVYVMPFDPQRALVEYTLFSPSLLKESEYREGLKDYISRVLKLSRYTIREEEYGVIPMTNARFPASVGNIIHTGTAGGRTKASTGYTFQFIQKQTGMIIEALAAEKAFRETDKGKRRFHFYDSVLLDILYHNRLTGADIFTDLFSRNNPQQVFKFLDNETSIWEEPAILLSLPVLPFFNTAVRRMF